MGRIQDEVNRRTVVNFLQMMRTRSKFKAHMSRKHSSRMAGIPQIDVPEIFIENEEDRAEREAASDPGRPGISRQTTAETTVVASPTNPSSALSPTGINTNPFFSVVETRTSAPPSPTGGNNNRNTNPFLSPTETANALQRSWTGVPTDLSAFDSFFRPDDAQQASHRTQGSAYSFELHEPEAGGGSSNRSSRRGSTVRPEQVTEMLNSSVWMDSIRRSATLKRPGQGGSEGAWGQWQ